MGDLEKNQLNLPITLLTYTIQKDLDIVDPGKQALINIDRLQNNTFRGQTAHLFTDFTEKVDVMGMIFTFVNTETIGPVRRREAIKQTFSYQ